MRSTIRFIRVWSHLRCRSTATLRSFEQRLDSFGVNEIFLNKLNPSGAKIDNSFDRLPDYETSAQLLQELCLNQPRYVSKCIVKEHSWVYADFAENLHVMDQVLPDLSNTRHLFLLRHPLPALRSYLRVLDGDLSEFRGKEVSLAGSYKLHQLWPNSPVLNTSKLLINPRDQMVKLCQQLKIQFEESMLTWPSLDLQATSAYTGSIENRTWHSVAATSKCFQVENFEHELETIHRWRPPASLTHWLQENVGFFSKLDNLCI